MRWCAVRSASHMLFRPRRVRMCVYVWALFTHGARELTGDGANVCGLEQHTHTTRHRWYFRGVTSGRTLDFALYLRRSLALRIFTTPRESPRVVSSSSSLVGDGDMYLSLLYPPPRGVLCVCVPRAWVCGSVVNLIFQYKTNWPTNFANHIAASATQSVSVLCSVWKPKRNQKRIFIPSARLFKFSYHTKKNRFHNCKYIEW